MIVGRKVLTQRDPTPSFRHRGSGYPLCAFIPSEVEEWHFVRCLIPIECEAAGPAPEVDPHGLTERLRPFSATKGQRHPIQPGGKNGGRSGDGNFITHLYRMVYGL